MVPARLVLIAAAMFFYRKNSRGLAAVCDFVRLCRAYGGKSQEEYLVLNTIFNLSVAGLGYLVALAFQARALIEYCGLNCRFTTAGFE